MSRNIKITPGEFYHVYNRGVDKRKIFQSDSDYGRFLALLYLGNSTFAVDLKLQGRTFEEVARIERKETLVDICAYCFMPNHFHLLLHEKTEGGVSHFMQKIATAYTMYFNKKNERSGVLFQGKFKAEHVDKDTYLKYLLSYIHLNPVKIIEPDWKESGITDRKRAELFLNSYQYSSYPDFLKQDRIEKEIINKNILPEYFETIDDFKDMMRDWLEFKNML